MWLSPDNILPPLGGEEGTITVSGISGGAFAAADLHTVWSKTIQGAGYVVGGPYSDTFLDNIGKNMAS